MSQSVEAPIDHLSRWAGIVLSVRRGDEVGGEELYAALLECARPRLFLSVDPQTVEDHIHEIMLIVLAAIRSGDLRDPDRLMGFVRTVTRRRVAAHIRGAVLRRQIFVSASSVEPRTPMEQSPEERACQRQRVESVRVALKQLKMRDREILVRFYLREQRPEQICGDMSLTETQFRLYKSRAIAKCAGFARPRFAAG